MLAPPPSGPAASPPPVGPVAPTHKTLTEVEPRIAVNATNTPGNAAVLFIISQPGSYYLTGNITGQSGKHGILIASNNVTLDLMGFAMLGVSGTLDGIIMENFAAQVVIRNGMVAQWGRHGISAKIDSGRIEGITAGNNGGWGIDNRPDQTFTTHVVGCEVFGNGWSVSSGGMRVGESAVVVNCVARSNSGPGFAAVGDGARFEQCVSHFNSGEGFAAGSGAVIVGCIAEANSGAGIRAGDRTVVANCVARATSSTEGIITGSYAVITASTSQAGGAAFSVVDNCRLVDCTATSTGAAGFSARDGNAFTGCRASDCVGDGFNVRFGNRLEACMARANTGDGIETASGGHILNCMLNTNGGAAGANIRITGNACRIEGNSLIGAAFGIQTTGGGNLIIRNSSRNSGNNYGGIAPGNDVGPIGSAATAASPWANIQY